MLLNISDIQHFSLGDGPGIRSTVFFKGCGLHCPWCHNPETILPDVQMLHYKNIAEPKVCGKKFAPQEILEELILDKCYYEESGGGVTLSGGEVMLQADGAAELAKLLTAEGISVYIDTAGFVPYSEFEKLNPFADEYLYDYKTASAEKYSKVIGGDLNLISENLMRLIADGKNVSVRIPLIPGFNTDSISIEEICHSLQKMGIKKVDLLPFHRLGSGKYEALGLKYAYCNTEPISETELDNIVKKYQKYFNVKVET